jgi:hypothetical protein
MVNVGRDNPALTGKPTFVVEVQKTGDMKLDTRDFVLKSDAPIGKDLITRVWEFKPDGTVSVHKSIDAALKPSTEPFNAPRVKPPSPKELSEQALSEHRAIVTAAREANVSLQPGDRDALVKVVRSGVPVKDAVEALKATRTTDPAAELARRFNLPSDAERTFPPNKSGLPTKPPTARKARGKIADLAEIKSP